LFALSGLLLAARPHSVLADEKADAGQSDKSRGHERDGDEYRRQGDWEKCGRSMLAAAEGSPEDLRQAQRSVGAR